MREVLVTGAAGFIGYHLSQRLLEGDCRVTGIDNLNDYYDPELKKDRIVLLQNDPAFRFKKIDISDYSVLRDLFDAHQFDVVYHLAAQAGVRYSLENPQVYVQSNLVGFVNLLECCKEYEIGHLIYASSSSVYGKNEKQPYSVHDSVNHPVSLYAATKKSNELLAHSYSHLYRLPTTGLRFFTVYGPWGRPDMAYFKFVEQILNDHPIDIYNNGDMARDFTYIADIVESLYRIADHIPTGDSNWNTLHPDPATSNAPYRIFNIGNNAPVNLMQFLKIIQELLGKKAMINFLPMQPGDVKETWADSTELYNLINYSPNTTVSEGMETFIRWYRAYYNRKGSVEM